MQSVASRFLFSRLHYPMKPVLLALMFLSEEHRAQMAQSFELVYAPDAAQAAAAIAEHGARITVVLTIGATGLSAAQIDALPALTLICALGAGYENIAVAHAKARGVVVATGAGTNDDCVADHTWGLLIAAQRRILPLDKATRAGIWRTALPLPPNVSHKRLGIIGLGTIGKKIAQRALGFEIEVGYHNRSARTDVPYRYFGDVKALAEWSDFLVVATPGGAGTKHLVNADVLNALGARGGVTCGTWTMWCCHPMWRAGRPGRCRLRWTVPWKPLAAIWQARRRCLR